MPTKLQSSECPKAASLKAVLDLSGKDNNSIFEPKGACQSWYFDEVDHEWDEEVERKKSFEQKRVLHPEELVETTRDSRFVWSSTKVVVIAGIGDDDGIGAIVARSFAREGYAVALLGFSKDSLVKLEKELNKTLYGEAIGLTLSSYSSDAIASAWTSVKQRFGYPSYEIRVAIWNFSHTTVEEFPDMTSEDVEESTQVNTTMACTFAYEAVSTFIDNGIEDGAEKRGTLVFRGAAGSMIKSADLCWLENMALGALLQDLRKSFEEFGIHFASLSIDSSEYLTDTLQEKDLEPEGEEDGTLSAECIAKSYRSVVRQERSEWKQEFDFLDIEECTDVFEALLEMMYL